MNTYVASDARDDRPWYQHLGPWLLMLPPLAAVAGGVAMIWLATHTPAALVIDDYARIEAITAARFAADARAASLGMSAEVAIDRRTPGPADLTIRVGAASSGSFADILRLRFQHATDAALDREVLAPRVGEEFRTSVPLGSGTYLMEIAPADGTWRLATRLRPSDRLVELGTEVPP